MSEFETGRVIYLVVLLAMVAGWFFMNSRENLNKSLQYAAIWAMIFIGGAAAVGLWNDINSSTLRGQITLNGGDQIAVPRSNDGHYYLTADVNGATVRFVVDTGATEIVLTQSDAARAGLDPENLAYLGRANTANGEVRTAFVRLNEIRLGDALDRNVQALVNQGQMDDSLLGMGYLQRWGSLEIRNNELVLTR